MAAPAQVSFVILLSAIFAYSVVHVRFWRKARPLPSGPKRRPFVGNALQMPLEYMEHTFASWAKIYGDLMYIEFFRNRTIVISSQKIARDLLEKRGAKYSSRPHMVTLVELVGWDPTLSTVPYATESFRKQRRWIRAAYGETSEVRKHDKMRHREACILLSGLMSAPNDFVLHIRRYMSAFSVDRTLCTNGTIFFAAIVVESVYGHRITSLNDEYVTLMDDAMAATVATGTITGTIMDMLPFLKHVPAWMPGAGFKRAALRARKLVWEGHHQPYRMARRAVANGDSPPSFISNLTEKAEELGRLPEEEKDIIYAAGAVYAGATDTTKTVLLTFILAMVLHPEVYAKVQEELDRVVGKARLPTLEDRPNLSYVDCVLKETYRWHAPVPMGVPHFVTADDNYSGYHIPKDTTIMVNLWGICRDERTWEDPAAFRPERFMDAGVNAMDTRNVVFGHGRRLCPGRQFGDTTLFLAISNIAATLDIRKSCDVKGLEITPKVSFVSAFISHPEEFVCAIAPRSLASKCLVAETLSSFLT